MPWTGRTTWRPRSALFADVAQEVTRKLDDEDRVPINRYFAGSIVYPPGFATDWNRSYVMEPEGTPIGAAVFLHGLTDAPYSLRHLAEFYRRRASSPSASACPATAPFPPP